LITFRLLLRGFEDKDRIKAAIKDYGCNMFTLHTVLGDNSAGIDREIRGDINTLDLGTIEKMLLIDTSEAARTRTLIMTLCTDQPAPTEEGYFQSDIPSRTLAGAVAFKAVLHRHGRENYHKVKRMASIFGRVPLAASAGGWLWAGWCHYHIADLPHLDLIPMVMDGEKLVPSNKKPEKILIGDLAYHLYSSNDAGELTADPMKYYIPSESNHATFDAFFRSEQEQKGICLQMTIQTGHSLTESGFQVLEERLSASNDRYFVFVIPKGQKFECEAPLPRWQSAFSFFILELDGKHYWSPLDL
jgi:hypothetical protein